MTATERAALAEPLGRDVSLVSRSSHDPASALGSVLLGGLAAAMIAARFETAGIAIGVSLVCAFRARAGWPGRGWWITLAWGSGLALLLNLYLVPGTPLALPRLFGALASAAGARAGALLALRLLGAAVALHGLRAAWPGERAADELAGRLKPLERLGVPIRNARTLVALALRFAPLVAAECRRIARLQELRAGRPARGLREKLERQRAIAVPAVVAAIENAERVALGLEARYYRLRPVPAPRGGWPAALAGWAAFGIAVLWRA